MVLLAPTMVANQRGFHRLNQICGYLLLTVLTAAMIGVAGAADQRACRITKEAPKALLKSAAALWVTNILVFASWYWRLDGGGPNQTRSARRACGRRFSVSANDHGHQAKVAAGEQCWRPGFVDYLFLALTPALLFRPPTARCYRGGPS